ncbi:merozoite surface protein 10, putative [Plasmodium gallinaceum]|uniref:Merozoite surface protein 10, putative n=1 Tax=Plasmodium gallinaceum TaxID=5849 RepID=A0A1J1GMW2_PLAGA|nr:merozoite surface protein 10, putative [Plasmodium gallinaceum]CRG93782.1 merozoite surface protein 10, putative [Plasmodium gallinaceum]
MIFLKCIKLLTFVLLLLIYSKNVVYTNVTNIKNTENINKDNSYENIVNITEKKNSRDVNNKGKNNNYELEQLKVLRKENKEGLNKENKGGYKIKKKEDETNKNGISSNEQFITNNLLDEQNSLNTLNMSNKNKGIERNTKGENLLINNSMVENFFLSLMNQERNDPVIRGEDEANNLTETKVTNENNEENIAFTQGLIKSIMNTKGESQKKAIKDILENPEDLDIITCVANDNFQKGKDLFNTGKDDSEIIKKNIIKRNNDIKETTNLIDESVYKLEQVIMKVRFYTTVINNFIHFKSNYVCEYSKCGENARCYVIEKGKEQCRCRANYIQDTSVSHFKCIPLDNKDCSVNNGFCDINATCSIANDKIKCQCNNLFIGDGIFCVKNFQVKQSLFIIIIVIICFFQKYFL